MQKILGDAQIEMQHAAANDPHAGTDHRCAHQQRQHLHRTHLAIQQQCVEGAQRHRHGGEPGMAQAGQQERQILHAAHRRRAHRQRCGQQRLPQIQKPEQAPPAFAPVCLAQIVVRSARARNRSAEFGPHQPIAQAQQRTGHPADQHRWASQRRQRQRNGDERADADHVEQIGRQRAPETQRARRGACSCGRWRHHRGTQHALYAACVLRAVVAASWAARRLSAQWIAVASI